MITQTATLEITGIGFDTLSALTARAKALGKTAEKYARELIEKDLHSGERTFDEILVPIRRQVEEGGITDEELDDLFMQARRDYYREQMERR